MSTKKSWYDEKINVRKLNLDLQNPRVPKYIKDQNDEIDIRNYLLDKESVLRIARSIAKNGYHKSAVAIVVREKGKLIVLDGNRRLAACQFLLEPKLAPNTRAKKEFEKLNKILDKKQLDSIKITIAPSRKDAEKEIWDIHVNQLLKPWETLQKLRMYRNLIDSGAYNIHSASLEYGVTPGDFKDELARLYFYEQILEVDPKGEEELLKSGFNKIGRLMVSANGKKLLNYIVSDKGEIVIDNQSEFNSKLKKLIPYIVDPSKIGAQAKQEDLERDVFPIVDPITFPKSRSSDNKKVIIAGKSKNLKIITTPKPLKIFVIMAFAGLDDVFKAIKETAEELLKSVKVFYIQPRGAKQTLDQKITTALDDSDFLIAVLSMGDKEKAVYDVIKKDHKNAKDILKKFFPINHNVLVELGFGLKSIKSRSKDRDMFILVEDKKDGDLTTLKHFSSEEFFDIRNRDQIFYKNILELKKELKKSISESNFFKLYLK